MISKKRKTGSFKLVFRFLILTPKTVICFFYLKQKNCIFVL